MNMNEQGRPAPELLVQPHYVAIVVKDGRLEVLPKSNSNERSKTQDTAVKSGLPYHIEDIFIPLRDNQEEIHKSSHALSEFAIPKIGIVAFMIGTLDLGMSLTTISNIEIRKRKLERMSPEDRTKQEVAEAIEKAVRAPYWIAVSMTTDKKIVVRAKGLDHSTVIEKMHESTPAGEPYHIFDGMKIVTPVPCRTVAKSCANWVLRQCPGFSEAEPAITQLGELAAKVCGEVGMIRVAAVESCMSDINKIAEKTLAQK